MKKLMTTTKKEKGQIAKDFAESSASAHMLPSGYFGVPFFTDEGIFGCCLVDILHTFASHGLSERAIEWVC